MAVRDDFSAGEVLSAADLNDTFASKLDVAGGKILQIVRATDTTDRSTSSTSYVDVTGMSVSITPQKSDSAILVVAAFLAQSTGGQTRADGEVILTDSSNNALSGTELGKFGFRNAPSGSNRILDSPLTLVGYSTPATTSSVTYKMRFLAMAATMTTTIRNNASTGQMYAIEVSA